MAASAAETLIFLHIPKTAGSTVHTIVRRQFDRDRVVSKDLTTAPALHEFEKTPPGERAQIKLLLGHMTFGVHDLLPQASTYMTILRDPLARTGSLYHWLRLIPEHPYYEAATTMDLKDFVLSGVASIYTDNGQVRFLSRTPNVPYGSVTKKMLEEAKTNIAEHFSVVGLSERFDESLVLSKRRLGWKKPVLYGPRKVNKSRPKKPESEETRAVVRANNEFDLELYDYVADRLQRQIDAEGADFHKQLAWFGRINRPLVKTFPLVIRAQNLVRRMKGQSPAL